MAAEPEPLTWMLCCHRAGWERRGEVEKRKKADGIVLKGEGT